MKICDSGQMVPPSPLKLRCQGVGRAGPAGERSYFGGSKQDRAPRQVQRRFTHGHSTPPSDAKAVSPCPAPPPPNSGQAPRGSAKRIPKGWRPGWEGMRTCVGMRGTPRNPTHAAEEVGRAERVRLFFSLPTHFFFFFFALQLGL